MNDTNDCGMPVALIVALWLGGLGCICAALITFAVVATLAGVGR